MAAGLSYTNISPAQYSGGTFGINLMPWLNFYTQKKLRDQAREDAFYKFFGEMNKGVTSQGMATNDIPGLMQRKNEWQQYALQNKNAIAHPSLDAGKAYGEYLGRYNDMQQYIAQSANKYKALNSLQPIMRSPNKNALLNASTMNAIHAGSLPLDHKDYIPFDPNSIEYNPQPFDLKQQNALKNALAGMKPTNDFPQVERIGDHQERVTHNYKFSPEQMTGMYNLGASQYDNNPSFRNMIDNMGHSEQYNQLNQVYKEHFGHDIQDEHDLSAAYVFSQHPSVQNKVETRNIPYSPWERASANLGTQEAMYNYRKQQEDKAASEGINGVDNLMDQLNADAKKAGNYSVNVNGNQFNGYLVPVTQELSKSLTKKDPTGKHNIGADELYVSPDGQTYLPVYYQRDQDGYVRDDKGNLIADPLMSQPVSRAALRASYGHELITRKTNERALNHPKKNYGQGGLN